MLGKGFREKATALTVGMQRLQKLLLALKSARCYRSEAAKGSNASCAAALAKTATARSGLCAIAIEQLHHGAARLR